MYIYICKYIYICIYLRMYVFIYMYIYMARYIYTINPFVMLRHVPPRTVSSAADVLAAEQTAVEALNLFVAAQVAAG